MALEAACQAWTATPVCSRAKVLPSTGFTFSLFVRGQDTRSETAGPVFLGGHPVLPAARRRDHLREALRSKRVAGDLVFRGFVCRRGFGAARPHDGAVLGLQQPRLPARYAGNGFRVLLVRLCRCRAPRCTGGVVTRRGAVCHRGEPGSFSEPQPGTRV